MKANAKPNSASKITILDSVTLLAIAWIVGAALQGMTLFSAFWLSFSIFVTAVFLSVRWMRQLKPNIAMYFLALSVWSGEQVLRDGPEMFPLLHFVEPAKLKDVTVAEALQHLSQSKDDFPIWKFEIQTEILANKCISVEFSKHTTLAGALRKIMREADAGYSWRWSTKGCGNAPAPSSASFTVSTTGSGIFGLNPVRADRQKVWDQNTINRLMEEFRNKQNGTNSASK